MRENIDIFINEYKSFIRDFKMDSLNEKPILSTHPPKKGVFSFLYWRGNNKLDELMKMGGVIVGSKALKFYHCGKTPLIDIYTIASILIERTESILAQMKSHFITPLFFIIIVPILFLCSSYLYI